MSSNAPIGHLILNGGSTASVFHMSGGDPVTTYAMYVDLLELQGGAINHQPVNGKETYTALNIDSNLTIYYLDAVYSNLDISEKLNGRNGGRLIWVSNYWGQFSVTNITYPDGRTFQFNRGLAQSLDIDSDGDGIINGLDPTPFPEPPLTATNIAMNISLSRQGSAATVAVSWQAYAYSTNTLEYKDMAQPGANWQVLTNFVQGASTAPAIIYDPVRTNRLYRVLVSPLQ